MFQEIIEELAAKSMEALPETGGTCPVCGKATEITITVGGKGIRVRCMCECDVAREQAFKAKLAREEKQRRIAELRKISFTNASLASCQFVTAERTKAVEIMERYHTKLEQMLAENIGVMFCGPTGTGKTYAVACLINALVDDGIPCMMTSFPAIADWLQEDYSRNEKIERMNDAEILAIDDLGAERTSPYMQETVERIIDARYRAGKPLIVTTNLTPAELKAPADMKRARIYSRIAEMCVPVMVTGEDRRRQTKAEKAKSLLNI